MNDLISGSFKRSYTDLKRQAEHDLEFGGGVVGPAPGGGTASDDDGGADLDHFFQVVENVKEDMQSMEKLYRQLQAANEEAKRAHDAATIKDLRCRMDADVEKVLKLAQLIKAKITALEKSNAVHRNIPGCGPGSSADRTRTSVVGGLGRKLKDTMDDFQGLRVRMAAEYRETVERRFFTVTGKAPDEQTVERLIETGESENFLRQAIQQQGRGQIMDTISEIQERHDAVKEIERGLLDLHQIFLDMAALVEAQGQQLNDIERHVAHASSFVTNGVVQLETAREYQKSSRKWTCIAIALGAVVIVIIVIPVVASLRRSS
ncbi:syntaxin-124-like [Nymphaea colorata]|uniref:t-SNARE coiled-coil homology domain-containing protein n=1 Tax=Nymphaea colorata TaxID=210225 RepID=A0A5K0UW61_9MAGN|nr:syntaxin-124-like [Nymphaea colorata]